MGNLKYLLADPSYILDTDTWKDLIKKANQPENVNLDFSDVLKKLIAVELYARGTKEELEGISLDEIESGVKRTCGDGDFEIYDANGRYMGVATTDSGMLALIPYSLYEKNRLAIRLNNPMAGWIKLEEFKKGYRSFITDEYQEDEE